MKKIRIILIALVPTIILTFGLLYLNGNIGVSKSNIEKQARIALSVDTNWHVVQATGDGISGMLFYDETFSDYKYVIFCKKPYSFGYSFASGGCTQLEMKGVVKYYRGLSQEAVYLSMNKQQVNKVEIDNGYTVEKIELDHTRPFALILSNDLKGISFYTIDGNIVEILGDNY